ncbi:HNH endonuclease [Streptomyces sp. NPDC057367]|uniref:HNH endonuclease signature motif containing protein n=1 Tax=Streptomyces sp. NPDC057367 TaxID=3346108 RepID=UPI00364590B3
MNNSIQYSRERLIEAAAQCSDIDEVIAFFGTRPYASLRRYLTRRFAHFGIDTAHFTPWGRRPRPSSGDLSAAIGESSSIAETLRRLERPDNGRQRALLRQWVAEEGLTTTHFLGQAHRRGMSQPALGKKPEEVLVKRDDGDRTRTAPLRRALRLIGVPEECAECGIGPEWLGKPMTLEIDHVNGDRSDNRRENLRLLCPNCHATTSTWCRGGARRHAAPGTMADAGGGGATATRQT